jgi:flagellar motor component MotA
MNPLIDLREELVLIKRFIVMPLAIQVLDRDMRVMERSPLKMPRVYIQWMQHLQDQLMTDMIRLRRQLRERGLRIYEQRQTDTGIQAKYVCRGYHHEFSMIWGLVRAEVETTLRSYVQSNTSFMDLSKS